MRRGEPTDTDLTTEAEAGLLDDVSSLTLHSRYHIWQAASLMVGLYGEAATNYADSRSSECRGAGNVSATIVWETIRREIERLLDGAPEPRFH